MTRFFCYGTLKRGFCRDHYLDFQKYLGEINTLPKYKLYRVSNFPGLIEADEGVSIKGQLYEIDEECLKALDRMEGHPHLFKRDVIELFDGSTANAYFWQGRTSGMEEVGDCWIDE
jgi:gamma-glutamylaminecyclotransferase